MRQKNKTYFIRTLFKSVKQISELNKDLYDDSQQFSPPLLDCDHIFWPVWGWPLHNMIKKQPQIKCNRYGIYVLNNGVKYKPHSWQKSNYNNQQYNSRN